jgi:hypothetical protein
MTTAEAAGTATILLIFRLDRIPSSDSSHPAYAGH